MLWAGVKLLALVSDCHCEWLGWQGAARALRGTTCRVMCREGAAAWQEFAGQQAQHAQRPALESAAECLPTRRPHLSVCSWVARGKVDSTMSYLRATQRNMEAVSTAAVHCPARS